MAEKTPAKKGKSTLTVNMKYKGVDSKRYHPYIIEDMEQGVVGNLYFKKGMEIPDEVTVVLTEK
jgi:hypothetical protein